MREFTPSDAPNSSAWLTRASDTSTAKERTPIALATWMADRPTGPMPNTASVSRPLSSSRSSAAIGGAHAARHCGARGEADVGGKMDQRAGRYLHVVGMTPVRGVAEHGGAFVAHLDPAGPALIAIAATLVVIHHHAIALAERPRVHVLADLRDHAARLVAGDDRRIGRQAVLGEEGGAAVAEGRAALAPVMVQVAAAETRRLHFEHDLVVAGDGIVEAHELELAMPGENDALHGDPPRAISRARCSSP